MKSLFVQFAVTLAFISLSLHASAGRLVGSVPAEFDVSGGQASYTIPIAVAPGRAGMQPELSLNYSSQQSNGVLGVGWSLAGGSTIYRCSATIEQDGFTRGINFDSKDRYCLDGQRLVPVRGVNGRVGTEYRTELDGYARIVSEGGTNNNPYQFIVQTKSGQIRRYGGNGKGANSIGGSYVSWNLRSIKDTTSNGNPIWFNYSEEQNTSYLTHIAYPGGRIEFVYEARNDAPVTYLKGELLQIKKRLKKVVVKGPKNGVALHEYNLNYAYSSTSQRSQITSIRQTAGGHYLTDVKFTWKKPSQGWLKKDALISPVPFENLNARRQEGSAYIDLNGDGLMDVVRRVTGSNPRTRAFINQGNRWVKNDAFNPRVPLYDIDNNRDMGTVIIDINGDGLSDMVQAYWNGSKTIKSAWLNTGSGWTRNDNFAPPAPINNIKSKREEGTRFTDLNGDGLVDIVRGFYDKRYAWLNTGNGWKWAANFKPPVAFYNGSGGTAQGSRILDVNGDGLPDIVNAYWNGKTIKSAWLNTGSGWKRNDTYAPPAPLYSTKSKREEGTRFVDLNSDGLVDVVRAFSDSSGLKKFAWLNTGKGWKWTPSYNPPAAIYDFKENGPVGVNFADVNGDGLVDLLRSYWDGSHKKNAWLNTGKGWKATGAYAPPVSLQYVDKNNPNNHHEDGSRLFDVNGDGLIDIVRYAYRSNGDHIRKTYVNRQGQSDVVVAINNDTRVTKITYSPLTNKSIYKKHSNGKYPNIDSQAPMYVVSKAQTENGVGGFNTVNYRYEGLKINVKGRGALGFRKITESYPETQKTTEQTFHQGPFPFAGNIISLTEKYKNRVVNAATYQYHHATNTALYDDIFQLSLYRSIEKSYELNGKLISTVTTTNRERNAYGDVGFVEEASVGEGGTFKKITRSTYEAVDESLWRLGRLSRSVVQHWGTGQGSQMRGSAFEYDNATGLLTHEKVVEASSVHPTDLDPVNKTLITKQHVYDGYGRRTQSISQVSSSDKRRDLYYYDNALVKKSCNAANYCQTHELSDQGRLLSTTNLNELKTRWQYDVLGRMTKETRADNTVTSIARYFMPHSHCYNAAKHAYTCERTAESGSRPVVKQFDKLGRLIRTVRTGFDGRLIYADTQYNAQGLVEKVSRNYFMGEHVYWATSEYDALDRVVKVTEPGPHGSSNEILTKYQGATTISYRGDERLQTISKHNAAGQLTYKEEEQGAYTDYTYFADGSPRKVIVAGKSETRVENYYDRYGRKSKMYDPNMGWTYYTYNGYGELIQQKDNKGQIVKMTYDRMGRMIKREEKEGVSQWKYANTNAALGSRGQLIEELSPGIRKKYTYDRLGRSTKTEHVISGRGSFVNSNTYDSVGRVRRVNYPGSKSFYVENLYNANGYLERIRGHKSHAESHSLAELNPYISDAVKLADEFLNSAKALKRRANHYQHVLNNYQAMLKNPNAFRSNLNAHKNVLQKSLNKANKKTKSSSSHTYELDPKLKEHINHASEELKLVNALLNNTAARYEQNAAKITLLIEQTLAAVDQHKETERTLDNAADAYGKMIADKNAINYWRAIDVDASGRISAEVHGNGIVTDYNYHLGTGQLQSINSGLLSQSAIRHLEYEYDAYQNVTLRDDLVNDIRETYQYDRLDRLTKATVSSGLYSASEFNRNQNVSYDVLGNITHKSQVGKYTYGAGHGGPHAVTAAGGRTYAYDKNGNMLSGDGRTLKWSTYNKPLKITRGNRYIDFKYGPDRSRYEKINHDGAVTTYIGKVYEKTSKPGNVTEEKHYIYAGGQLVAEHIRSSEDGVQTRYLHKDALGSIDLITDSYANVVDRRSYDAWGKLRNLAWKKEETNVNPLHLDQLPYTNMGYTGHEQLQEVDLIHMNGRVYDATIGRFLSADPYVQSTGHSQNFNRYSYVMNNPLKYTDPSGYFFKKLFRAIGKVFKAIGNVIKRVFKAIAKIPILNTVLQLAACTFGGPIGCAAYAGISGYALTGSFSAGLKAALITGFTIGASAFIRSAIPSLIGKAVAHGVVGGLTAVAQGGKFGRGFASSFFTKIVSPTIAAVTRGSRFVGAAVAALVGGTASVIGGGKFANGASTSMVQYLFNQVNNSFTRELVPEAFRRTVVVPPEYQVCAIINGKKVNLADAYIYQLYLRTPRWEPDNPFTVTQAERVAQANQLMHEINNIMLGPLASVGGGGLLKSGTSLLSQFSLRAAANAQARLTITRGRIMQRIPEGPLRSTADLLLPKNLADIPNAVGGSGAGSPPGKPGDVPGWLIR